jgi:hypothetical protein
MQFFSLNLLGREHLVVYWLISSISYKLSRKGPKKTNFLILNFPIFPMLMHFCWKMIISMAYFAILLWQRDLKETLIPNFAYLEGFLNTWNSKTRQMSKIQWIQHTTVSINTQCKSLKSITKGHRPLKPCTI